ncbi:hypothetical protein K6K41_04680 [Chenggangzhangella methanolivorans]|uniref:Uncharacterized protein n=1 Tax=Chenggangzhangella methanolivorans TaxID=1437009 RepID=A0A9E6URR0_9HYPH|nr:hypothetical protein K6K41_04680 [Chenggangzhangella methanolivorans]
MLVAAALAALTEDAARREPSGAASPAATAAYATGASAALGLALAMAMRDGGLTVALSFLAMALGLVAARRNIRALGWLAIVAAAIVLVRIGVDPRIVGDDLGDDAAVQRSALGLRRAHGRVLDRRARLRQGRPTPSLAGARRPQPRVRAALELHAGAPFRHRRRGRDAGRRDPGGGPRRDRRLRAVGGRRKNCRSAALPPC